MNHHPLMIIPALEIMDEQCVSLNRGNTDQPMVWHIDPVEKAKEFAVAGVEWMHLTDFDAIAGSRKNHDLKLEIIRHAGIPVQMGGGLRSISQIDEWIELGVGRIVVSTLAAINPQMVKAIAKQHPDQIVVAVEIWQGRVMTHGWTEPSVFTPLAFVREYQSVPLAGMIVTDIDADIENRSSNLEQLGMLAAESTSPVIAGGMIQKTEDLIPLKQISNVVGAVVGTALYRKTVNLDDILSHAAM